MPVLLLPVVCHGAMSRYLYDDRVGGADGEILHGMRLPAYSGKLRPYHCTVVAEVIVVTEIYYDII